MAVAGQYKDRNVLEHQQGPDDITSKAYGRLDLGIFQVRKAI